MELSLTQAWALLYLFLPPSPSANSLGPRFPLLLSPKFRWRALWVICLWILRNEGYRGVPVVWLHKHPWMITVHQGTLDSEMKDCLCPQGAYGPGRPKNRDRKFPQNEVGNVRAKKRALRPREPLESERWGVEVVFFFQRQLSVEQCFPKGIEPFKHFNNHKLILMSVIKMHIKTVSLVEM